MTLKLNQHTLIGDIPILSESNDRLKFSSYAKVLARALVETKESLSIGIFAGWGEGKTSMMNLIKHNVEEYGQGNPNAIGIVSIWFNSWQYESEKNPILPLCASIIKKLANISSDAARFEKIINAIKEIIYSATLKANIRIAGIIDVENKLSLKDKKARKSAAIDELLENCIYYNTYTALNEACKENKNKIIVFIDDLDRCNPISAINLIEDIKLIFCQNNFAFVFGMDKRTISSYLSEKYKFEDAVGNLYLDKLFQVNFFIPDYGEQIGEYAKDLIRQYFSDQTAHQFNSLYPIIGDLCEKNPRTVKKWLNNILIDHRILKDQDEDIPLAFFGLTRALQMNEKWQIVANSIKNNTANVREVLSNHSDGSGPDKLKTALLDPIYKKLESDINLVRILESDIAREWLKSNQHDKCWQSIKSRNIIDTQHRSLRKDISHVGKKGTLIDRDVVFENFPFQDEPGLKSQIERLTQGLQSLQDISEKSGKKHWDKLKWTYPKGAEGNVLGSLDYEGMIIYLMSFTFSNEPLFMFIESSGVEFAGL